MRHFRDVPETALLDNCPLGIDSRLHAAICSNTVNNIAAEPLGQHKVKGTLVNYKAAEKYTGNDEFDLLILFPAGFAWEVHLDVSVR